MKRFIHNRSVLHRNHFGKSTSLLILWKPNRQNGRKLGAVLYIPQRPEETC